MKTCSVDNCVIDVYSRGFCQKHYTRNWKNGDPLKTSRIVDPNSKNTKNIPEYKIWVGIKERCFSKNANGYKSYGGRGITVCDNWVNSFSTFYKDMGSRPSKKHQLDRINNDGNYSPDNCEWIPACDNARKRSTSRMNKETAIEARRIYSEGLLTMQNIADKFDVGLTTIYDVIRNKTWRNI